MLKRLQAWLKYEPPKSQKRSKQTAYKPRLKRIGHRWWCDGAPGYTPKDAYWSWHFVHVECQLAYASLSLPSIGKKRKWQD